MIDISLPLNRDLITYPGDAKYEEYEYYTHEKNHVHIMRILMETHSGTHFDAPYHMIPDGMKADEIDLDRFIGKATIVKVDGNSIDAEDIPDSHNEIVLFKTRNSEMYDRFDTTFTYLSPEGADKLVDHNVKLVGIDYVGIGADLDGVDSLPVGFDDATDYPLITKELVKRGYSAADIKKILGKNVLRVLKANRK